MKKMLLVGLFCFLAPLVIYAQQRQALFLTSATPTSGDVAVRVDGEAGARVDMRSLSGSIESAFPLHVTRRGPVGRAASGEMGAADADLTVRTLSGDIRLLRPVVVPA